MPLTEICMRPTVNNRTSIFKLGLSLALAALVALVLFNVPWPDVNGQSHAAGKPAVANSLDQIAGTALQTQPTSGTAPALVETTPADLSRWDGSLLVLTFDQAVSPTAANLVTFSPDLPGQTTVDGATLTFTPASAPMPGTAYAMRLEVQSADALPSEPWQPVELTLIAAAPLTVTSTQPTDGAAEVDTDTQIIVVFNRPVVPLTGADDQAELPSPLTVEPEVEGQGRWLNTSVYSFQPLRAFAGATEYTVTVADVTAIDGSTLPEPYQIQFTTAAPIVVDATPNGAQIRPDATVRVDFSQPMDQEGTAAAFSLSAADGTEVDGVIGWLNESRTLVFTPTAMLEFGVQYTIAVDQSAPPSSQIGSLRTGFSRTFTVVPLPGIAAVSPVDGATEVTPDASVVVRFTGPVSRSLVLENIDVRPMLTTTQVYSYYSDYLNELQLSWFKEPNTAYTITLGSAIGDEYGNTLTEDYVFSFSTGDYVPFVRLEADRFTHFTAVTDTRMSILYRNVPDVTVDLYRVPQDELLRLTGSNQWEVWQDYTMPMPDANRIWSRTYEAVDERNIAVRQVVTLTTASGEPLSPGVYFVEVQQPVSPDTQEATSPNDASRAMIVLSNINVLLKKSERGTSLVWLTDLLTGQPVAEQTVRFYHENSQIGEGISDANGIITTDLNLNPERSWTPVLAMVEEQGEPRFGVVSSDWSSGIAVWDFNLNGGYWLDSLVSYFYTDRPIYRPGQTVYWKGIVRTLVDEVYQLPPSDLPINVTLRDPQGNVIYEDDVTLNELGTVNGEFSLSDEALTGGYYLDARLGDGNTASGAGANFMVASYRVPEFEISVTSAQEEYVQEDTVELTVQANYFSGGPLGNAPISWRLISSPYVFTWDDAPRDRYYSFQPFDPNETDYDPYSGSLYLGLIREGTGTTNSDGSFTLELPADLAEAMQSQLWTFDFTVQSPTNQFVSANRAVPIHAAEFHIGVSGRERVAQVGAPNTIDLVTLKPDGTPYADAAIDVVVYEYLWNSVYSRAADGLFRWETSIQRTPVYTTSVKTDSDGAASFMWTPPQGGQYQIGATATDSRGNMTNAAGFVWISTDDPNAIVAWPRDNNDRFELVADKTLYELGDTARILVPSPFMGETTALVSIERNGILSSRVMILGGTSETIEVPIEDHYLPNIYVSVVLAKGVDETNPTPAMRYGYVELPVDTASKALSVTVDSSAQRVQPGATVTYTLSVRDQNDAPVENAELSLAIVDRAVLALTFEPDRALMDVFYYERPLSIQTSSLLTINRDRVSQQLSEGAKGGGGGGGIDMQIREEFPDIAYWRATVTTDDNGEAIFTVEMPDNLTTWRLVAKTVTADTAVGNTTYDVVATKDLQLRPILPRFFTAGDQAQLGAVILNTTGDDLGIGQATIALEGASINANVTEEVDFALEANGQFRHTWPVSVAPTATQVVVTMTAVTGVNAEGEISIDSLSDGVRLTIPVKRYESPETVATAGIVPPGGTVEAIRLPASATDQGALDITLEPSLAGGMVAGLEYLREYPYECNEQTVSSFLPNLFTKQAMYRIGVEQPDLAGNLDAQISIALQRLINRQNQDGGWGYWPGERSSVFISAYVLWGLHTADTAGLTVPDRTLQNAVDFIERSFVAPSQVKANWQLNEMAFMHFVLAGMGQGDPGRASTLYDVRERMGIYGKALLALALAEMQPAGAEDARVGTLLDDLYGAANITGKSAWWQEDSVDYRTMNTDTRTTAMVIAAYVRLDPQNPLLPQAIRWLMQIRQDGYWPSTQETAWSLIGLSEWLELTGELDGDYAWTVDLNDQTLGSGEVGPDNVIDPVHLRAEVANLLRDQMNVLSLDRTDGSGTLYYSAYLRYFMDAATVDARDRGIIVDRSFALAERESAQSINSATIGDVISVTVTLIAPTDLYHLRIDVPIPAGTEPIDPSLATTSDMFTDPGMIIPVEDGEASGTPTWWRYWVPTYTDMRDDRIGLFATYLPAGTYEYTFNIQATLAGEFNVLPTYAEQMYFTDVWGRSSGGRFTIEE